MGKQVKEYVRALECSVDRQNIMTVEHRSNNPKRDYLFCNKLQAKHIPANPLKTQEMFSKLSIIVKERLTDKKIVVVGFAETATAIGAYISYALPGCVYHLQTTREDCSPMKKLIEFEEEHSHATEQYLYGDIDVIPDFDYILFVEDEISTGKTILNFITEFKKIKSGVDFGVASICNWQSVENRRVYKENNIDTFALIYGELLDANAKMSVETLDMARDYAQYECSTDIELSNTHKEMVLSFGYNTFMLERTGRVPHHTYYMSVANKVLYHLVKVTKEPKSVLILGTEEFMHIPIAIGSGLAKMGHTVSNHATSRSSIDILADNTGDYENELVNKFKLHSAYDINRITYVYNLRRYDEVLIITDGTINAEFKKDILSALISVGNKEENIAFIKIH